MQSNMRIAGMVGMRRCPESVMQATSLRSEESLKDHVPISSARLFNVVLIWLEYPVCFVKSMVACCLAPYLCLEPRIINKR